MKKYFGTDGIRGEVNKGSITGEMFFRFGLAAGTYFSNQNKQRHKAIIAKDTRLSGYMLEPALVSGLISAGMDVLLLGPLPTNGLAMLTKSMKADLGIMLTASHNPHTDNGLKLFGPDGMKLSDKVEKQIEKLIDDKVEKHLVKPNLLGRAKRLEDATENYIGILKNIFPKSFNLSGVKIFLDCANGASYKSAPALLRELGAEVVAIGINPDGFNINKNCGSTHPELIQQSVKTHKADIGIAFDGDADRVIMCDEKGEIIDGDQIIAMIAKNWKKKKILKGGVRDRNRGGRSSFGGSRSSEGFRGNKPTERSREYKSTDKFRGSAHSERFKPRNIEGFKENKPREGVEKDYRRKSDREKTRFFGKKSKDFKNRNFNAGNRKKYKNWESFN